MRLNDSIRAYVYCLLGSQVQPRQAGSSLDLQQEFLVLVNDLIDKQQSLQESIDNFEDALSKTRGKINYVIAKNLYMIPSDMYLNKLGQSVKGFNDKIRVASGIVKLGVMPDSPKPIVHKPISKPKVSQTIKQLKPETARVRQNNVERFMYKRSIPDTHERTKLLIGGGIVTAGIAYTTLT